MVTVFTTTIILSTVVSVTTIHGITDTVVKRNRLYEEDMG
jgi:hypothetical protein